MRITSIQLEIKERSKEKALEHVLELLEASPPSDLILLPEMWTCGYFSFDRYRRDSESLDGPVVRVLREKASELDTYLLMGSIAEREEQDLFNTALLLDPRGQIISRYRKIHLFGYQSEERRLLKPGREVAVATTPWGKAGLSTCYDLRFPEFYRRMLDEGATFFLVVSAWPKVRQGAWNLFNRVRAHENLAYLFSCNCAGMDRGFQYAGHSMFVDPLGEVVAEGSDRECIVTMDVDMSRVETVRKEFSALNDRVFK